MKETLTIRQEDLPALAERVIFHLTRLASKKASVLLLEGDLGAGKTTFTQALAAYVGVNDPVNSPTFTLKKEYKASHSAFTKVVHVDAYRFVEPKEAKVLKLEEDLKDAETIVVIEWPSKMHFIQADMMLSFVVVDDDTREVTLTYGE